MLIIKIGAQFWIVTRLAASNDNYTTHRVVVSFAFFPTFIAEQITAILFRPRLALE